MKCHTRANANTYTSLYTSPIYCTLGVTQPLKWGKFVLDWSIPSIMMLVFNAGSDTASARRE